MSRTEWLAARRNGIGGSDAAAVLGVSPWKSALELYAEKIGVDNPEYDEPEFLYWGRKLEPAIADRYAEETKREVYGGGDYLLEWNPYHPFMCCTVDRYITDAVKGRGVLEIKTANGFKAKEWEEEPPIAYQVQLQHNLVVTGCTWGSFALLVGGQQFFWLDVPKNDRFCDHLIVREMEFWDRVQRRDPPPPGDPAESAHDALQRLYPHDTGETIELPADLMETVELLENLKAATKEGQARIKTLENLLRAAIGPATFGVLPNGLRYSLKTVKRAGYTVDATEYRQLRRVAS